MSPGRCLLQHGGRLMERGSADAGPVTVEPDPLVAAAAHLAVGNTALALRTLLPALDRRAAAGDRECALAAAALRLSDIDPPAPRPADALAWAMDRLLALVQVQEEQIRTLHDLMEDTL